MARRQINMKDFTEDQASRLRALRYYTFGTERPSRPRWLPRFQNVCFIPHLDRGGRSLAVTLDGRDSAVTIPLLKKLEAYGLVDRVNLENEVLGRFDALVLNGFGIELLLKGHVDRTVEVAAKMEGYRCRIMATKNVPLDARDLAVRNSVVGDTKPDNKTDARSIGINMTPQGVLAMVYDSEGLRVTDIFARYRDADDLSWLSEYQFNPDGRREMTREDMKPALILAKLFGLPESAIFKDDAILRDISVRDGFIYDGRPLRLQEPSDSAVLRPLRSPRF